MLEPEATQVIKWLQEYTDSALRPLVRKIAQVPMSLTEEPWVGLLWDSINR